MTKLSPATYLIELSFDRPVEAHTLHRALTNSLGFGLVVLDQSNRTVAGPPFVHRFVGKLERPVVPVDPPGMRWLSAKPVSFEPFADLSFRLFPHPLRRGATYESRFLSRAKSAATRQDVQNSLAAMGFEALALSALKRNMRLPGRPGASLTLWYGLLRWVGPDTIIVSDDPFYFEDMKEIPQ